MRGCYCAMATAHMLGLDAPALAQAASMVDFVRSCQVGRRWRCSAVQHIEAICRVKQLQTCFSSSLLSSPMTVDHWCPADAKRQSILGRHTRAASAGSRATRRTAVTHSAAWRLRRWRAQRRPWTWTASPAGLPAARCRHALQGCIPHTMYIPTSRCAVSCAAYIFS